MSQELSKEDFAKMQQQAINRVREMQRQSAAREGAIFESLAQADGEENAEERESPKRIFEPETKPQALRSQKSRPKERSATAAFFEMDSDIALILPLLLLLQREGADEMLILALLYIMA